MQAMQDQDVRTALDLPPCCQVGFVYPKLEEAIALYKPKSTIRKSPKSGL